MQDDLSPDPSNANVLDALDRVLSSKEFANAERLREFLRYIVMEKIEGRGKTILGKRIAQDVYERRSEEDIATANVVRVDAGRLRRRLDIYYLEEGAMDPLRIHVPKGGYAPHFEAPSKALSPREVSAPNRRTFALLVIAVVALGASAILFWGQQKEEPPSWSENRDQHQDIERAALYEQSPTMLQARNLAQEARAMLFPATQPARLIAALTLFNNAIELNPDYFGGYAGAAQAAAMYGGLSPDGPKRDQMLADARQYAEEAMRLAPSEAWSQSSMAFLLMFERDFDEANRLSRRAVMLDQKDLVVLEFDAIIAFASGDFERAVASAAPEIHRNRTGSRFPWRNVYGDASFYLGEYQQTIDYLLEAAAFGGPVSEINSAHLIAALQASGRTAEAQDRVREYKKAWPDSRIEELMTKLFRDPEDTENLMSHFRNAGWTP